MNGMINELWLSASVLTLSPDDFDGVIRTIDALNYVMLRVVMGFLNGFIAELLACAGLFVWRVERRPDFRTRLCMALISAVAVAVATYWPVSMMMNAISAQSFETGEGLIANAYIWICIIRFVLLYFMCYWAIRFCFIIDTRQGMFYTIAAVAMQHLLYCGAKIVTLRLPGDWSREHTWPGAVAFFIVTVLLCALGYRLFAKPLEGKTPERLGSNILMLFFGLLLCVNVFSVLYGTSASTGVTIHHYTLMLLTRFVTCVFVLAMLTEIANRIAAERDGVVLQRMLDRRKTQLAHDKATIDLINVKTHDLKKQLDLLGGRISGEEIDELRGLVNIYDSSVRTGNEALDVLLANKSLVCEQRSIRFDRMIDGSLLSFMKSADIYSLFGNALDNAMEAVEQLSVDMDRYISMSVRRDKGMLLIHVENPYAGMVQFDGDLPRTSKSDTRYHGFGIRSMKIIVERYDGVLSIDASHGVFSLDILLPLN